MSYGYGTSVEDNPPVAVYVNAGEGKQPMQPGAHVVMVDPVYYDPAYYVPTTTRKKKRCGGVCCALLLFVFLPCWFLVPRAPCT